mmetsp:Transcript_70301/g.128751  ORF Transcript_70301/g.128751 Transcript_70301/m.128751 type:complete len:436 (-) Transcript_70301:126-1433(-)
MAHRGHKGHHGGHPSKLEYAGVKARYGEPVIHSRCVQMHCADISSEAVSMFNGKGRNGEIPLVLIPQTRCTCSMVMTVPEGVFCLMQKFGRDVGDAAPGLHFKPAYWRVAYVVTKQACTYDAPVAFCPTADDVRVNVDVVVVFSIVRPYDFIYRLGAKNFDEFLSGTVDEAIRMLVRKQDHRTVYSLRGDRADELLKTLNGKFNAMGVNFSDVKITAVWLPDSLAGYLEKTTKLLKMMDKDTRQNEFEKLNISMESDMDIENIKRKQEQVLVTEAGRKRRAELEFEQRSVKAEEDGRVAMVSAEGRVEVMKVQTNTELNRTKMKMETVRTTEYAQAQASANTKKIQADLEQEEEEIKANWQMEKMVCEAEVTKFEAGAEAEASLHLAAKRKHEMDLREKGILAGLAERGRFNLIGTPGDRIISAMMSGTFGAKTE